MRATKSESMSLQQGLHATSFKACIHWWDHRLLSQMRHPRGLRQAKRNRAFQHDLQGVLACLYHKRSFCHQLNPLLLQCPPLNKCRAVFQGLPYTLNVLLFLVYMESFKSRMRSRSIIVHPRNLLFLKMVFSTANGKSCGNTLVPSELWVARFFVLFCFVSIQWYKAWAEGTILWDRSFLEIFLRWPLSRSRMFATVTS